MVITVNKTLDLTCRCGNPSGEVQTGEGHCHCADCNGVVTLTVHGGFVQFEGKTRWAIVSATSRKRAIECAQLSGLEVSEKCFKSWLVLSSDPKTKDVYQTEVSIAEAAPGVWLLNDVEVKYDLLRDFS
jgi:hypothetical protein